MWIVCVNDFDICTINNYVVTSEVGCNGLHRHFARLIRNGSTHWSFSSAQLILGHLNVVISKETGKLQVELAILKDSGSGLSKFYYNEESDEDLLCVQTYDMNRKRSWDLFVGLTSRVPTSARVKKRNLVVKKLSFLTMLKERMVVIRNR